MTGKLSITETDLRTALLAAIRPHPECVSITGVTIARHRDDAEPSAWGVRWESVGGKVTPLVVGQIVRQLQGEYLVIPDEA